MTAKINKDLCCYCGGCTSVCPVQALELKETFIHCDAKKCINCGICQKVCPVGAIKVEGKK
jgi:ferredoxin